MSSNKHIIKISSLSSPSQIISEFPNPYIEQIEGWRTEVENIITGKDNRLLMIVGPCSIHDISSAKEYGEKLIKLSEKLKDKLFIVMRVYFEKPRTIRGWKGLINDPNLDQTCDIEKGLRTARKLLLELNGMGLPCGCEFLEPISPQYIADLVTWGAIGARTTESQIHRQLSSGLSMPIGFKNGTGGSIDMAINAMISATNPHIFFGINEDGKASIISTKGNPHTHIILRGGKKPKTIS
jgi:3-deoxy-7-phosphoheptulonate synthase